MNIFVVTPVWRRTTPSYAVDYSTAKAFENSARYLPAISSSYIDVVMG